MSKCNKDFNSGFIQYLDFSFFLKMCQFVHNLWNMPNLHIYSNISEKNLNSKNHCFNASNQLAKFQDDIYK